MTVHRVERKSGLVRQLNATDVFLINTFGYALGIALTVNPGLIGQFAPSANIYIVLFLGLVAALFNGFTYGLFASVMPKTGGDFIYVSANLGRWLGFLASFGFTFAQLYGFALNSYWAITQGLSPALGTFGLVAQNDRLLAIATWVGQEHVALSLGVLLMLLLLCLFWLGLGFSRHLLLIAFCVGMLGPVLQLWAFCTVDHAQFVVVFNNFVRSRNLAHLDYQTIIELGRQQHLAMDRGKMLTDSVKALPLGFLTFLGFTYSAYMGSEVQEASKSQLKGIFWALGFGTAFFVAAMGRYYHVVGNDFNAAISARGLSFPNGNSLAFFAGILLTSKISNALMNIGNIIWFVLVPFVILQVCSRNIQAWAVEYLLPQRVAKLNRFEVPGVAASVAFGVGVVFLMVSAFKLHNYNPIGAVALSAGSILLAGASAIVYANKLGAGVPSRRSILFSPGAFRFFGWGTVAVFLWVGYAAVRFPAVSGLSSESEWPVILMLVAIVYLLGTGIFVLSRHVLIRQLKREGLTLDDIWGSFLDE